MRVVNNGASCDLLNFGVPEERRNPASAGKITKQSGHGKAEFAPPYARYTPEPNYVGQDEFEFEALALGRSGQPLRLRVLIKVAVVAR